MTKEGEVRCRWCDEREELAYHAFYIAIMYIESIGVGIPPRRSRQQRQRRQYAEEGRTDRIRNAPSTASSRQPPEPFGRGSYPVSIVGQVSDLIKQSFPTPAIPPVAEIALIGRSNVGKSTLLNALVYGNTHQPDMPPFSTRGKVPDRMKMPRGIKASASPRPGETRQITFYQLQSKPSRTGRMKTASIKEQISHNNYNDHGDNHHSSTTNESFTSGKQLWLVDLPGYGFSYASPRDHDTFQRLITTYLLQRGRALKRVLLLVDARHNGLKKADIDFLCMLERLEREQQQQQRQAAVEASHKQSSSLCCVPNIQLVLTKCDLVQQDDLARRAALVQTQLADCLNRARGQLPVMLVSARPGVGFNNFDRRTNQPLGGVLELQKELGALALETPPSIVPTRSDHNNSKTKRDALAMSTPTRGSRNRGPLRVDAVAWDALNSATNRPLVITRRKRLPAVASPRGRSNTARMERSPTRQARTKTKKGKTTA